MTTPAPRPEPKFTPQTAKVIAQALSEPDKFRWRIDSSNTAQIKAMLWGTFDPADPIVLLCKTNAIARSVVLAHNAPFSAFS